MRRFARGVTALLLCLLPALGYGLTLGSMTVRSALNEPFEADIQLAGVSAANLDNARVGVASNADFRAAGIERSPILTDFRFRLVPGRGGKTVLRVSSVTAVRDPILDFLVALESSEGRMVRQYTVLLDPPDLPADFRPSAPVDAPRVAPSRRGNIRRIPAPGTEAVARAKPATVVRAPTVSAPSRPNYGPTRPGETAGSLAQRLRPSSSVSMNQMMMALLRANPQAFIDNNVNNLKAGVMVRVPDQAEISSISRAEANRAFQRQYRDWKAGVASTPPPRVERQVVSEQVRAGLSAVEVPPRRGPAGELILVPPDQDGSPGQVGRSGAAGSGGADGVPGGVGATGETNAELRRQRDLAQEQAHTAAQEAMELRRRTDELEQRLDRLEKALTLKSQDLAALQARMALSDSPGGADEFGAGVPDEGPVGLGAGPDIGGEPLTPPVEQPSVSPSVSMEQPSDGGSIDEPFEAPDETADGAIEPPQAGPASDATQAGDQASDQGSGEPQADAPDLLADLPEGVRDNWPLFAGGAALLVLLFAGLMLARRRRASDAVTEPADVQVPMPKMVAGDVLTEVNQYLLMGHPQQAEERLKQELAVDPDRLDLSLKLLEVYSRTSNKEAFDALAAEVFARLGRDPGRPDWQRVAGMGRRLSPANPLYAPMPTEVGGGVGGVAGAAAALAATGPSGHATADAVDDFAEFDLSSEPEPAPLPTASVKVEDDGLAFAELEQELRRLEEEIGATVAEEKATVPAPAPAAEPGTETLAGDAAAPAQSTTDVGSDLDELDFDLSFDDLGTLEKGETDTQSGAAEHDGGLDFDWGSDEQGSDEATGDGTVGIEVVEPERDETAMGALDDSFDWTLDEPEVKQEQAPAAGPADSEPDLTPAADEFSLGAEADQDIASVAGVDVEELTTKLDLARAYVDMDDKASAIDILSEVLRESSGALHDEAEALRKQLG